MLEQPEPDSAGVGGVWPRLRQLGGQSGLYLIADALSKGLALLLLPIYLRYLAPSDYGILAITLTVTILFTILLSLGLQGSIQRLYFEIDTDDERRTLYASVLGFLIVVPGVAVLVIEVLGQAGALDLFRSTPYDPYLRLAVLTAYLSVFREIPVAIYTVRGEARRVFYLLLANALLLAALSVVFIVLADQGAIGAVRATAITAAIMGLISIALTLRESHPRFSRPLLNAGLALGVPFLPHLIGHWVLTLADRAVLDRFVSIDEVGVYALGANIAIGAVLIGGALGRAFTPAFTREMKAHGSGRSAPILGTWWVATLVFSCTAIALFAGPLIHLLFDQRYMDAVPVVIWLVGGYLALGIYNVVTQGTWFSMRVNLVPVITIAAGVLNVGLAIVLVPRVGPIGAAVATAAGFVALAAMQGALSQQLYPIPWEYGRWIKLFLAGGVAFALGTLVGEDANPLSLAVKVLALLVIFPATLQMLGFFRPSELVRFRTLLATRTRFSS